MNKENIKEIIERMVAATKSGGYGAIEGSYTRDIVINPVSIELDGLLEKLNAVVDRRFSGTATGQELDLIVADDGITRETATKSTGTVEISGINGTEIKKGYLLSRSDGTTYTIVEDKIITNLETSVKVECGIPGTIGNCGLGEINKFVENYPGLTGVTNTYEITGGKDAESDAELVARRNYRVSHPATSWNQWWFRDEALKIDGVGDAHCVPRHNGAGTVKVIITNENSEPADVDLIIDVRNSVSKQFLNDIELTVETIAYKELDLVIEATLNSDFDTQAAKLKITKELENYYKAALFKSDKIYYSYVHEVLMHSEALYNVKALKVIGGKENINISESYLARTTLENITLNGE